MSAVPNQFEAPTELSNVVLIVEGKKLHVNKDFLAVHSPVFEAMFNRDFAEKGKEEVELKDVIYKEFVDLLNAIHPGYTPMTTNSVSHILKLADQFQIKDAREQSVNYLMMTISLCAPEKMILAEKYNIPQLAASYFNHCLKSFSNNGDILDEFGCDDFAALSDAMKVAIFKRMKQLRRK